MSSRCVTAFLVAAAVAGACAGARDSAPSASATGASAVASFTGGPDSAGRHHYRVVNQRYIVSGVRSTDTSVLVRETSTSTCCTDTERPIRSTVDLAAWAGAGNSSALGGAAPAWTTTLEADHGELWDAFYRATLRGCCDAADVVTLVSLRSGVAMFFSTRPAGEGTLIDPVARATGTTRAASRYAAFHDVYSAWEPPESRTADGQPVAGVVGVLQYGPADGPVQRAVVQQPPGDTTVYRFAGIDLAERRQHNGNALEFDLVVRLRGEPGGERVVRVPVREDRLVISGTVAPAGLVVKTAGTLSTAPR